LQVLEEIRGWKGKPKELVVFLTSESIADPAVFGQVVGVLIGGSKVEAGVCAEVVEQVSKEKPESVAPYIDGLIDHINSRFPRVKWGVQEAIGNLSAKYPAETEAAIPNLLVNTKDDSTVVKWCAAYAISEIAKNNPATRASLVPKMSALAEAEANNGVKNVYLKALKKIGK
jgi:hypothetical protein